MSNNVVLRAPPSTTCDQPIKTQPLLAPQMKRSADDVSQGGGGGVTAGSTGYRVVHPATLTGRCGLQGGCLIVREHSKALGMCCRHADHTHMNKRLFTKTFILFRLVRIRSAEERRFREKNEKETSLALA